MGLFYSLFSSFQYSLQYTMLNINFAYDWIQTCGPHVLEATALPTKPQPLSCAYKYN